MINFAYYTIATGAINTIGKCSLTSFSTKIPISPDEGILEIPSFNKNYWVDVTTEPHTLMDKTSQALTVNKTTITSDGVDECLITGITNPSIVTWPDGQQDTIEDGEVGFSVDQPGTYVIKLTSFKHFDEEVTIEAVPTA